MTRTPLPRLHPLLAAASLAMGLTLGIAPAAQAQSLQTLYDAARSYDATYLGARALADSASYVLAQREALMRPSSNLTGAVTRGETDPPTGTHRFTTSQQLSVSAKQPLFNRSNSVTIDQARRNFNMSRLDLEAAEQDLIVRVSQAYFDVLGAQDTLAATRGAKAAFAEQLASAKRNFEVGTTTITDTREAQAKFDLAGAQELSAENDLLNKRLALDQLVGGNNITPYPLVIPVVLPTPLLTSAEAWVTKATTQHPAVLKAELALQIAQLETDKARAGHLPTLDLVGSVGTSRSEGSGAGTTNSGNIGVQLNVPLFAGFAVQNRVKETLSLEEQSRFNLEAARRSVTQGTRVAYYGVQSLQAQVLALEAAESSIQLALDATKLGYKVGVRVNLDVLNAQTQLYTTRRDLAKARYDVLLNGLRLRQAAGQLQPADVITVSQLLAP
jgi:outer membrane protein